MMNPMYTTIENQVRTDGSKGLLYDHFDSYNEAVAKFHTAAARGGWYSPYHRERRQGAGLSFLPPGPLSKGGLRRKSSDLTDWRAE